MSSSAVGLLSFYSKMALKGDPSAQLEAAKAFDRYSEDVDKRDKMATEEPLNAVIFLLSNEVYHSVIYHALKCILNLSTLSRTSEEFVNRDVFLILSKLVSHFHTGVQVVALQCIGQIAQYKHAQHKLVHQSALLNLFGVIRTNQKKEVLIHALNALAKCNLRGEMCIRMTIVWGLHPIKELVNYFTTDDEICLALCQVFTSFEKIRPLAEIIFEEHHCLDCLATLLLQKNEKVRHQTAEAILYLTSYQTMHKLIIEHELFLKLFDFYNESNFEVRHCVAKILQQLYSKTSGDEPLQNSISSAFEQKTTLPLAQWILKSIGCYDIKQLCIRAVIKNRYISFQNKNQITNEFTEALLENVLSSIDFNVKQLCLECLYLYMKIPDFRNTIIRFKGIAEALIPQLSFKDVSSKRWATLVLCFACESPELVSFLMNKGIESHCLTGFLLTNYDTEIEKDVLSHVTRICAILSDFASFRKLFQLEGGFTKIFYILDHIKDNGLHILCLRIIKAFVENANREGSGNAALSLIKEKRINLLIQLTSASDVKAGSMASEVFLSYLKHDHIPVQNFWKMVTEGILLGIRGDDKYQTNAYQKEMALRLILTILSKKNIETKQVNLISISCHLYRIFCDTKELSILKYLAAGKLAYISTQYPTVMEQILESQKEEVSVTTLRDYTLQAFLDTYEAKASKARRRRAIRKYVCTELIKQGKKLLEEMKKMEEDSIFITKQKQKKELEMQQKTFLLLEQWEKQVCSDTPVQESKLLHYVPVTYVSTKQARMDDMKPAKLNKPKISRRVANK